MNDQHIHSVAQLLKAMAHPIRLKILCLLQEREMTVGEIRERAATTHANISQHLTILRNQGVIDFRKDANYIYNRIADRRVNELIALVQRLYCDESQ